MDNKNDQNKSYSDEDEVAFILSLYEDANNKLKEVYKEQKKNKDDLLKEIALILLLYTISNNKMSLSVADKAKLNNKFFGIITKISKNQIILTKEIITAILTNTVKGTWDFYGKSYELKDIDKIVNSKFKGELYINRISKNEQELAKKLYVQINDFLKGEVDVNLIKGTIDKTFNYNSYNVKRLTESEINRSENEAFIMFCKENGITQVIRNEVLDSRTCDECESIHGEIYNIEDAPDCIHALCRGFNSIYK